MTNKISYDKFCDGDYLSDEELLSMMDELALVARAAGKLGKAFNLATTTAAHHWHAASNIAAARKLNYKSFFREDKKTFDQYPDAAEDLCCALDAPAPGNGKPMRCR